MPGFSFGVLRPRLPTISFSTCVLGPVTDGVASLVHFYFVVSVFYSTRPAQSDPARHRLLPSHRLRRGTNFPTKSSPTPTPLRRSTPQPSLQNPARGTNQPHIGHGPTLASAQILFVPPPTSSAGETFWTEILFFQCDANGDRLTACLLSISGVGGQSGLDVASRPST